jgi:hypothetical protein
MKICNTPTNAALKSVINGKYGGIHSFSGGEWFWVNSVQMLLRRCSWKT